LTYRALTIATAVATVAATLVLVLMAPEQRSTPFLVISMGASGAVTVVCVVTARRIGFGDRLAVAWLSFGISQFFLLVTGLYVGDTTRTMNVNFPPTVEFIRNSFTFAANLFNVIAYVLFARVWSGTGLQPRWRWLATVLSILAAVAVAGHTAWGDLLLARTLHGDAFGNLFSDVGDIISLSIIGPLAVTAIALRGGALAWPWTLLTLSSCAWLVYDVGAYFGRAEQMVEYGGVIAADLFALAAALAQAIVTQRANREGS
jgi:hypothetical protein